ncbi:unnamed protein product [Prorocentrum cordatum]|uniref:EamA domain-containing protein n=1 Tax=Prorocentrum cordatum TaxID=2364126 RepID=A0ABN9X542_9DINO|nr:unnamed protein product [Polarella glacialis]
MGTSCLACDDAVLLKSPFRDTQRKEHNLGITLGIALSGQVTASSWQPLQLLFGTALSFALGIEAPSFRKLAGVAMGMLGAALLVLADPNIRGAPAQTAGSLLGHAALFANTFSSGALFVIRKRLVAGASGGVEPLAPLCAVAWMHVLALPLVAALGVLATAASGTEGLAGAVASVATPPADDAATWAALAFYTLVPSVVCQSGTAWAAKALEPSTMATYSVLSRP